MKIRFTSPPFNQKFLRQSVAASDDIPTPRGWRCERGRRRISWLHQVWTDLNTPASEIAVHRTTWEAVDTAAGLRVIYNDDDDDDDDMVWTK